MITTANYFEQIKKLNLSKLPEELRKSHAFIEKTSKGGTNWTLYESNAAIKKTIDLHFSLVGELMDNREPAVTMEKNIVVPQRKSPRKYYCNFIQRTDGKGKIEEEVYSNITSKDIKAEVERIAAERKIEVEVSTTTYKDKDGEQSPLHALIARKGSEMIGRMFIHERDYTTNKNEILGEETTAGVVNRFLFIRSADKSEAIVKAAEAVYQQSREEMKEHDKWVAYLAPKFKKKFGKELDDRHLDLYSGESRQFIDKTRKAYTKPVVKKSTTRKATPKKPAAKKAVAKKPAKPAPEDNAKKVAHLSEELRFIRRFVTYDGRTIKKSALLNFTKGLQKSITERKIRKASNNGKLIAEIQEKALALVKQMAEHGSEVITITFEGAWGKKVKEIANAEVVYHSIPLIKRFISMMGERPSLEKVDRLKKAITSAMDKKKVTTKDIYYQQLKEILDTIDEYTGGKRSNLKIRKATLSGLDEIALVGK